MSSTDDRRDGEEYVFVKSFRHRSGKVLVASNYGLKAFRLRIRKRREEGLKDDPA